MGNAHPGYDCQVDAASDMMKPPRSADQSRRCAEAM